MEGPRDLPSYSLAPFPPVSPLTSYEAKIFDVKKFEILARNKKFVGRLFLNFYSGRGDPGFVGATRPRVFCNNLFDSEIGIFGSKYQFFTDADFASGLQTSGKCGNARILPQNFALFGTFQRRNSICGRRVPPPFICRMEIFQIFKKFFAAKSRNFDFVASRFDSERCFGAKIAAES